MAAAAAGVYNRPGADFSLLCAEVRVPFRELLKQLVAGIEGASGAVLLESAGEAVQWHAADERQVERLRLRSAYVAVVLQNSRVIAARTAAGETAHLVLQYDGVSFIAQAVEHDYFVVIELRPSANIGQALYRLQPMIASLRRQFSG
jgi:predicted regulator of Ras-like GTPase activity (Roadblock/LC7/MglB family)